MNSLQHLFFALTLSLGLTTTSVYAQQIRQPASILPWRAPQAEATRVIENPVPGTSSNSPAWLLETAERLPQRSQPQEKLPMVETGSFVNLGQLHDGVDRSGGLSQRNRLSRSSNRQPFNLFRALGIQANRPANRR